MPATISAMPTHMSVSIGMSARTTPSLRPIQNIGRWSSKRAVTATMVWVRPSREMFRCWRALAIRRGRAPYDDSTHDAGEELMDAYSLKTACWRAPTATPADPRGARTASREIWLMLLL